MSKILVIDDSGFQRKSICAMIEAAGYETVQAKNGVEGFEKLCEGEYACVFCDLLMPELDGFGFLEKVKDKGIEVPVIILTADKQDTSTVKAKGLGARMILNKPPKSDQIDCAILEVVSKKAG
jgi:CheY-like chemotaxis protein